MKIKIGNRDVGEDSPCFIIAELSTNHLHNFELAVKTLRAAKKAGADAIKIQTYTPDTLTINEKNPYFQIKSGLWKGKTLYELYQEAYTPWEWDAKLKQVAEEEGLIFFSTPFDISSVDFLDKLEVPVFKIASFELSDIQLVEYIASKGKPIIGSTGISTLEDIEDFVAACERMGNRQIALLKCTSAYPTPVEEANLLTLPDIAKRFGTIVGISDHTEGILVSLAAVPLGARIIERHFILDRSLGGPDAKFSLEPSEFREMVDAVRTIEKAMGKVSYELTPLVKENLIFARSLFVVEDIKKGGLFTTENVRAIRPGDGIKPKYLKKILGKKSLQRIKRGTPLRFNMVAGLEVDDEPKNRA